MRVEAFHAWIDAKFPNKKTAGSRKSEASRVEAVYGDLDQYYTEDRLQGLIETFTYSTADQRDGVSNPTRAAINGNIKNGLNSLKRALRLYQQFADEKLK
jgi:hypothetical protein